MAAYCPTCRGLMRPHKGTLQCIRCSAAGRARTVWRGGKRVHLQEGQQGLATPTVRPDDGVEPTLRPRRSDHDPTPHGRPHARLGLFPHDEIREGQLRFTRDVTLAVRTGKHLVAQAPTGIGKTAAVLAPAVADAIENGRTVMFLTSRQSQHRIAVDTLRAIRGIRGAPVQVVDLVAKRDMCLRPEADALHPGRFTDFCSRETRSRSCTYLGDVDDHTLRQVQDGVLHVDELKQVAKDAHLCPHLVAVEAAKQAHVVVADYNHLFSDIRDRSLERLGIDLAAVTLVVDEAHNLPGRIRQNHGHRVTSWLLEQVAGELRGEKEKVLMADAAALGDALRALSEAAVRDGTARDAPLGGDTQRIVELDVAALHAAFEAARSGGTLGLHRTLQDAIGDLGPVVRRLKRGTDAVVHCGVLLEALEDWGRFRNGALRFLRWDEGGVELHLRLLDPAVVARQVFDRVHSAVLMSGTLLPEMTRDLLGLDPGRTTVRSYESPFPPEHRLTVIAQGIHTRYSGRSAELWDRMAAHMLHVTGAARGNVAVFAPSYQILRDVRASAQALGLDREEVVEDPSWGKAQRDQVLDALEGARGRGGAVLWGVLGGSFSEGVDFRDNLLSAIVVVGLPLAPPDLEQEASQSYLESRFPGRGRLYASTYPAMDRVLQAMGRGIRSADDKCAVVLLDERYRGPPYRALLPADAVVTADPGPVVAGFLRQHGL